MTPTTDERLASVIRSLTEVVLPHLPADASLAQEQVQLAIGHLQILRLQFDSVLGFEAEELADTEALASELAAAIDGGRDTSAAVAALKAAIGAVNADVRGSLTGLNRAIERVVQAVSADGAEGAKARLSEIILRREGNRVEKDRRWFLPYGFDTMDAAA
ncbi:putative PP-loop superfamily ATPase [Sphingopyxis italica]|uniref:Putative PP-loop superfamily ATPase n=1 Tax=Sphingopyxis italica TaxID=1129133 RepID=A0A7X5XS99_9SPHN|nr:MULTISPECIES: hypothetical protein [Sphingopyxis]MDT7529120.1 hypothetical protein [Sphingopyxis sp. SE2]NJB90116.1 putative PP-loop superfamily ATPase [Sphingopyxis italica]